MTGTVHINIPPWQCCATCTHSRSTQPGRRICAYPNNYGIFLAEPDYWCQKYKLNWFKLRDNVELWLLYLADNADEEFETCLNGHGVDPHD